MKSMHGFLAVIILLMAPVFHVEAQHQFALKNGNQVVGDIQANTLKLKTGVGIVDVPVREITSIQGSSITLADGTILTGNIIDRTLNVQTRFGPVSIQTQDLKSVVAASPTAARAPTEREVGTQRNQGSFMSPTRVTSQIGPTVQQAQVEDAEGPKKRVAIRRFENKTAFASQGQHHIGTGMADMLTTALVNTGRFIVLEREQMNDVLTEQNFGASGRVRGNTAARVGVVEGAELLIYAAVTDYMADQSGAQAAAGQRSGAQIGVQSGSLAGALVGALIGGIMASATAQRAHVAIDLRIVDANTGRVVSATSVQGNPKSIEGEIAFGAFGGAGFYKTPIGSAIRDCINNAVNWMLITAFPAEKDKFMARAAAAERVARGEKPQPTGVPASALQPAASVEPAEITATDFAELTDVDKIPNLNADGREGYTLFLSKELPRAFAISSSGGWAWASKGQDPNSRAIASCNKHGKGACKLYAVDEMVVWLDEGADGSSSRQAAGAGSEDSKPAEPQRGFFSRFFSNEKK